MSSARAGCVGVVAFAMMLLACAGPVYAGAGDPDTTFGDCGSATEGVAGSGPAGDVVVQPDDRIVVAGTSAGPDPRDIRIARYMPDGTLDSSFSGDGVAIV